MFVTEDLKMAVTEAKQFRAKSEYEDLICLKVLNGGVKRDTFDSALDRISDYATSEDKIFYETFYAENSQPLCVMPKGHVEKCYGTYSTFFPEKFQIKIKDCDTTPGDDDILFKNRARRIFPIQVTKSQYTVLNAKYKWKGNVLLKAAIPAENGGTNFTIATAMFDFTSLLLLQKGIETSLSSRNKKKLSERAKVISNALSKKGIYIVDDNGQLCDPVLGCTFEPEWYGIEDKRDPNQIQFGHIDPLRPDKYMTRGMNIVPITRRGNLIQSDNSLTEVHSFIRVAYEHTRPR
jgi:hypothetical protein